MSFEANKLFTQELRKGCKRELFEDELKQFAESSFEIETYFKKLIFLIFFSFRKK